MTKSTKAVASAVRSEKREPNVGEAAAMTTAIKATRARTARVSVVAAAGGVAAPHSHEKGWSNHLAHTLGTGSDAFLGEALTKLDWATRARGKGRLEDPQALNAALALIGAIAPADELEGALAQQMAATHSLTMEMLARAAQTERTDHIQLYGGMAMKLQNVFVNQLGALSKLRGGGKQQVEVRHVYINGNAVIGDVHATGGGGAAAFEHQPHTQGLTHLPSAPVETVRGPDADGRKVPVTSSGGAK